MRRITGRPQENASKANNLAPLRSSLHGAGQFQGEQQMSVGERITTVDQSHLVPACADEAAWYAFWKKNDLSDLGPTEMAFEGGSNADRLSWVFISGYQAAIAHVFPEAPRSGWSAFAASEDKKDPEANPPLRLLGDANDLRLSGTKSWVAQSRHVDHLIVTAQTDENETICAIIDRHQDGISMSHRDAPGFLGQMSQGYARLEDVPVGQGSCLDASRIKLFIRSEAKFIMLAITGWLLAQSVKAESDLSPDFRGLAADIAEGCEDPDASASQWADLDDRLQTLFLALEAAVGLDHVPDWQKDRSLVSMYSRGLQKRAGRNATEQ